MREKTLFDINWQPIEVGQKIEVKICIGRYGQTETVTGIIKKIDEYQGFVIALSHDHQSLDHQRFVRYHKPGDDYYVPGPFEFDHERNAYHGYKNHNDFEHGHEAYVKIVQEQKA